MFDKNYITGIQKLDEQHDNIFLFLDNLKKALKHNLPKEEVIEIIKSMDFYVIEHFEYEENLGKICNFKKMQELKDGHVDFKNHYLLIKKMYEPKKNLISRIYAIHIVQILEDWIDYHFESIETELLDELKQCHENGVDLNQI